MGYLEKNLLPGETVEYRAHLHPIIFLQPAFFALVGISFIIFSFVRMGLSYLWVPGAVLLLYAAGTGIDRAIHYLSSEFAITNKRVVIKVGFIHRKTLEMVLTKVETIRVDPAGVPAAGSGPHRGLRNHGSSDPAVLYIGAVKGVRNG